ncbi:MAG: hypothetical protein C4516_04240 [Oxalobacter sp.]|nr:MAG: hypothetical protein C4516_04240 [Oxalobacter sp.]
MSKHEMISNRAAHDVLAERRRQKEVEGFTDGHDDAHDGMELAAAAACYALNAAGSLQNDLSFGEAAAYKHFIDGFWPWLREEWNPKDPRRDLVRAGALILAEIERFDRAEARLANAEAEGGAHVE